MTPKLVAALLEIARDLISQRELDVTQARALLDSLFAHDLDVQARVALRHAKLAVANADMSASHQSVARYSLARVVRILEEYVAVAVSIGTANRRRGSFVGFINDHSRVS